MEASFLTDISMPLLPRKMVRSAGSGGRLDEFAHKHLYLDSDDRGGERSMGGMGEASRRALPWFGSRLGEELVSAQGRRLMGIWMYTAGVHLCRWPWEASAHGRERDLSWRTWTGTQED